MRYAVSWIAVWLSIAAAFGQGQANPVSQSPDTASSRDADNQLIRQIETDWLKAERTTDPSVVDRVLADDWVNLTPTGFGPGKAAVLKNFREHTGEAPPYSVQQHDLHIFILNKTSAVAAYVKIYVADENKNVAREDTTHVFTKDRGTWKLRISRASHSSQSE
jgi:ketosteroid isomerase-like protein